MLLTLTSGSAVPILSNKYSENLGQMTDAVGIQFNGCDVNIALNKTDET